MQKIRYDLIGADKAGVKEHPQKHVESLGMKVLTYEGVPIADCIIMEVENVPAVLPDYISLLNQKSEGAKIEKAEKKPGKIKWIFALGVFCVVVMCKHIMSETSDERRAVEKERKERHCHVKWDSLSEPEKRIYLNEFIQGRGMGWSLSKIAIQSMEQGSKYPESILFEGKKIGDFILIKPEWGRISNAEEGIITYTIPFTAENAFRQTVRANLDLKIRYTAGCKAPTKVSSQVFER